MTLPGRVIDFRMRPPIPEAFPEIPKLARYKDIYKRPSHLEGFEFESGWEFVTRQLDAAHAVKALVVAEDFTTTLGKHVSNETVAALIGNQGSRFAGLASVDPYKGRQAEEDLERAFGGLGMVGLGLWPCFLDMPPSDKRLYPLYEICRAHSAFVVINAGVHFNRSAPMDLQHPRHFDQLGMDFPDLDILASHAGWPWILEMIAVCWRHPNVSLELSAVRHKHMMKPHSGWEPLFNYGDSLLAGQVVFGSSWPLLPLRRSVEEVMEFPIKDETKEKWLYSNAARLLKIDE